MNRVEAVVNIASGGVGADAPAELEKLLSDAGLAFRVAVAEGAEVQRVLADAVQTAPDLLVILAGDGTARAAAELCGLEGPLLAPLPGGTMNMLPHAVYGEVDWRTAMASALRDGRERVVGGGEIDGHRFLVAAILGAPALWAPAREAAREGEAGLAIARAKRALRRAFSGRLSYSLDGRPGAKAEALMVMCPITSRALSDEEQALEAAGLNPKGALDAARLGLHAVLGDWRDDEAVDVQRCRRARVWAGGRIPALLDGESVRLGAEATVEFRPDVVRLLAPPRDAEP